jgi:Ca-activated chloride channel family protein
LASSFLSQAAGLMLDRLQRLLLRRPIASAGVFLVAFAVALLLGQWLAIVQAPLTRYAVARNLLENGAPEKAAFVFETPIWRGVALYRAGRYQGALSAFAADDSASGLYNLGNSYARLGLYRNAMAAYEAVLQRRPNHDDARFNLELVRKAAKREQELREDGGDAENAGNWQADLEVTEEQGEGEARPAGSDQLSDGGNAPSPGPQEENSDEQEGGEGAGETAGPNPQLAGGRGNGRVIDGEEIDASVFSIADHDDQEAVDPPTEKPAPEDAELTGGVIDREREESMADEIVLRRIKDDPAVVLRARLNMALRKQRAER